MKSLKSRIYFPMTCNILTPGHIQCLNYLCEKGIVIVGLLTSEALKGYKKELMSWKDRKFLLDSLKLKILVVAQTSLNPKGNIKDFRCSAIASGDGFEPCEFEAIRELHLTTIDIKFDNESVGKRYSSSDIINKIKH
jgi:hypothetical protein